jgi:Icc-related predicted phosphoesterase
MKIVIKSDLHLESHQGEQLYDLHCTGNADLLVLAGDISEGLAGLHWALQQFQIPVVYVPGNHEFHGHHRPTLLGQLRAASANTHVHLLDRDKVVIGGVRFLGTTLWTDYSLFNDPKSATAFAGSEMPDHQLILESGGRNPKFLPRHAMQEHAASVAWLREQLAQPFSGKTVVVTHHAPCARSIAPRFKNDVLSPAFSSNLPFDLFDVPHLWIHGHVHHSVDYLIGRCRVIANPLGYAGERRARHSDTRGYQNTMTLEL